MAPITTASNEETHAALLDTLDMHKINKPFRNPNWRPPQRRNKNLKQILSEASRAQQSMLNTQQNSGASTPLLQSEPATDGSTTPAASSSLHPNPAQASQDLSRLVLEKNMKGQQPAQTGAVTPSGTLGVPGVGTGPSVTYTSLAAAPSLKPKKKYCDITGLPAKYKDPKTGLYYFNAEVYAVLKGLTTGQVQEYLATRGANTVLK
ncbi:chromatin-remodeling complex subunit ies6 [Vermiconidia calcicola]|uniref:Chromatin-remodeling complex subunit ies6 n=1 Tax=Vermiconidia calcicola TaxID=1690605 RepID=A0ACC3NWB8_9PEZI|nr:chromatin-remodeling complex subunit ies6 [Vermiconidia calcicola]